MATKKKANASTKKSGIASARASDTPDKAPRHHAVAKADGDAAVQAWIDLLPAWQAERARRIDAAVTRAVPKVTKAVKWHCAWYGISGKGFFLAVGSLKKYLKLVFPDGTSLKPPPPIAMKSEGHCALDHYEDDALDDVKLANWVKQGSKLPGWGKA